VEFDETNEIYGGIDEDKDEEEQRKVMKKMPKGEIKSKEDEDEVIGPIGPSSPIEENEDKPPSTPMQVNQDWYI